MELPYELLDCIFAYIDVKNILYKVDDINRQLDEIFERDFHRHRYWNQKIRSLFLKKNELFKTYNSSIFIYHNFCQTSIEYWMKNNVYFLNTVLYYTDKKNLIDINHGRVYN